MPSISKDAGTQELSKLTTNEKKALIASPPNKIGVVVMLLVFLVHYNGFAIQETITTPLVTDKEFKYTDTMNFNESFAYFLFAASGVLSLITFFFLIRFAYKVKDFEMQLLSLVTQTHSNHLSSLVSLRTS